MSAKCPADCVKRVEPYGRSLLTGTERTAYDRLHDAVLSGAPEVDLPRMAEDVLRRLMLFLRRDEPRIDGFVKSCSFVQEGAVSRVRLFYRLSREEIAAREKQLDEAAAPLLAGISDELSEFDRAVLLHDRLLEALRYDLDAPRRNTLAGALLDGRATCGGYAQAYQLLLQKAGLQALPVYGMAGGPHAWNIVRLDGAYYLCDPTWDDASLVGGGEFVSHQYLFWDDAFFAVSHTPAADDGVNLPLPRCDSLAQNYFYKTGTLLESSDLKQAEDVLGRALDRAAAYGYGAVEMGIVSPRVADRVETELNGDGALDRFVRDAAARKGFGVRGRVLDGARVALTYLLEPAPEENKETNKQCADLSDLPGIAPIGKRSCRP